MCPTGSSTSSTDRPRRRPEERRPEGRRRARRLPAWTFAAAVLLPVVQGCGFEPVHGERSRASAAALGQFSVDLIPDRTGQMLRNALLERFHADGKSESARPFVLKVVVTESRQELGFRKDESATRANLTLVANFQVMGPGTDGPLHSGTVTAVAGHNVLTSDFATLAARADARQRGIRQLADSLQERLSVWLLQTGGRRIEP